MKAAKNIIYKVLSVALLAAVWMLASCDSGFVQKTAGSGNTNVTVTVSAGNARTVSPEGRILDDTDWDITFKPTGITTGADEIKSKLSWNEVGGIFGSFLVPPGTYTVSVHSTPSGWTGQTDNVVVTASGPVSVTVFVRREHTGTGNFIYTLSIDDLEQPADGTLSAVLQPVDGGEEVSLDISYPQEAPFNYILTGTEVPAGYEIPVNWEEVSSGDFSLEVNGGVAVSVTDVAFPAGTVTVTVDDPERYTGTPFLKFSQPAVAPLPTQFTTPPGSGYYVVYGDEPGTYVLADATTSSAVLWTKGTDSKNIYVVPQSDISETMVLPEAISISDSSKRGFCFDDRLNLYVASDSGVTRYDLSNGTYSETNSLTILSDQTVTGVAFDTATNILWVLTYSDSTYTLQGYDNPAGYAVDAASVTYNFGTYSDSGAEISSFTVHNGIVYLALLELGDKSFIHNIYTAECPASNVSGEIALSECIIDLAQTAGISGISDNAVISDMSVADGALYVLFREVLPAFVNSSDNYSRGGVIKLNITGDVQVDKTFGTGGIFGWTTESAGTVSDGSGTNYNCYWPAAGSTDRFYGPSRFIAVTPKKLVIADDGGYYEDSSVIQKNRVVTVDLGGSQPGMTVKELNTVVEFDDTLSASGFGPVIPTGN